MTAPTLERWVVATARRLAWGDPVLGDELAQIGRIAAWQAEQSFVDGPGRSPEAWARRRARWAMIDAVRAHLRVAPVGLDELTESETPVAAGLAPDTAAALSQALGALPTEVADVLLRWAWGELDQAEAAARLQTSARSLRRRVRA